MNRYDKILYKCSYEENLEDHFEYETIWGPEDAVQEFLKYEYNNCDGWEWMVKPNKKSRVRVTNTVTNESTFISWDIEFEPSFHTWENKSE